MVEVLSQLFFYGSAILLGIVASIILERVTVFVHKKKKKETNSTTNTISESHIKERIYLDSDKGKPIDNAMENLKNTNIAPPFSLVF